MSEVEGVRDEGRSDDGPDDVPLPTDNDDVPPTHCDVIVNGVALTTSKELASADDGEDDQPPVNMPEAGEQRAGVESSPSLLLTAPALRVEELKEDGQSSACGSDEEGFHSHGSDVDLSCSPQATNVPPSLPPFVPPDDELRDRIIKQVDFYFSDANILKDAFLLKHVKRNKQGYVSLKLITSFRKVKTFTKDYRTVAYSLRQSENLEVNEDGTKVRRRKSLPDYDETTPSRSVVVVNLPFDNPSIENVAELFSECGEISLIRVLRPGKPIPQDVKKHLTKHPEIGNAVCAVVEFEHHVSAVKACERMTDGDDWRKGLRVVLLASKKDKQAKDLQAANKLTEQTKGDGEEVSPEKDDKKTKQKMNKKKKASRVKMLAGENESPYCSSSSDVEVYDGKDRRSSGSTHPPYTRNSLSPKPDVHHLSPGSTPHNTPRSSPRSSPSSRRRGYSRSPLAGDGMTSSPKLSPCVSPEMLRRMATDGGGSPSCSPWVQRRLKAQAEGLIPSPIGSPRLGRRTQDGKLADTSCIIRLPRGPDGTRGFLGRGKPVDGSP